MSSNGQETVLKTNLPPQKANKQTKKTNILGHKCILEHKLLTEMKRIGLKSKAGDVFQRLDMNQTAVQLESSS